MNRCLKEVGVDTFDPLDEDCKVVNRDSFAAHAELWRPGWEIDGFGYKSGDVCE